MLKDNWKLISVTVLIIITMVGYIYAEATASRERDSCMKEYVVESDRLILDKLQEYTYQELTLLNGISVQMTRMQKDIEYLKQERS